MSLQALQSCLRSSASRLALRTGSVTTSWASGSSLLNSAWGSSLVTGTGASLCAATYLQDSRRGMKLYGNELKKGMYLYVEAKGKYYEIIKMTHSVSGRGAAVLQTELREASLKGARHLERIRPAQEVEAVDFTMTDARFKKKEGDQMVFESLDGLEEIKTPAEFLESVEPYITPGTVSRIKRLEDEDETVVEVRHPLKVVVKVKSTTVAPQKAKKSAGGKPALLENGRVIGVPSWVEDGQSIVVKLPEEEFVGKATEESLSELEEEEDDEGASSDEESDSEEDEPEKK